MLATIYDFTKKRGDEMRSSKNKVFLSILISFVSSISIAQNINFSPEIDTLFVGGGDTPAIIKWSLYEHSNTDSIKIIPGWNTYFWDNISPFSYEYEAYFIINDSLNMNNYKLAIKARDLDINQDIIIPSDSNFTIESDDFFLKLLVFQQDSLVDSLSQYCRGVIGLSIEEPDINHLIPNINGIKSNYPNPFNNQTIINYSLKNSNLINLSVFNIYGQLIAQLYSGFQVAGNKYIVWDASNFSSGVYFIVLQGTNIFDIKKCYLIK